MTDFVSDRPGPVAFLYALRRMNPGQPFEQVYVGQQQVALTVWPNSSGFVGRSFECNYHCQDPAVSNKHLYIDCIIFEDDENNKVPPLVYVQDFSTNGTFLTRCGTEEEQRLSRRNGKVLLDTNDILRISPTIALRFEYSATVFQGINKLPTAVRREAELFADRYTITDQTIGRGGHGSVYVAIHLKTNQQFACKIVSTVMNGLKKQKKDALNDITNVHTGSPTDRKRKERIEREKLLSRQQFRECDVLQHLDHPNIVHLEKVFWSESAIFILQELVTGGDLFSYIQKRGTGLQSTEAAVITYQLLKGIEYLHDRNIVHRDLKPDNILISANIDAPLRVVITDFGSCHQLRTVSSEQDFTPKCAKQRMRTFLGTLEYIAPEIHNRQQRHTEGYTKAVDIWSLGIISTMLLTGEVIWRPPDLPLPDEDLKQQSDMEAMGRIATTCDLSILDRPNGVWRDVEKRPKDFIRKLLVVDEKQRLNVKQALEHPWFTNKMCREGFIALYEKAIASWQPRRNTFRVIEALDLRRLQPLTSTRRYTDGAQSPFFINYAVPFPQGELFASTARTPSTATRGPLETIGEEATPVPETPFGSPIIPTLSPHSRREPCSSPAMQDVEIRFGRFEIDHANSPCRGITGADLLIYDDQMIDDSYDLDKPARQIPPPRMGPLRHVGGQITKVVLQTQPMQSKRPWHSDVDLEDTYASLDTSHETVKFSKRMRML